ncbi:MAG: HAMP domain-containing protein, partial [Planctomycetota bacterium]|nr:HAMP domain-containing protein [Planctomycetota bacterium]
MSYRSFKHLLGETSLERKCRFMFGGGILILVSFSFYLYGQRTEGLVIEQNIQLARSPVNLTLTNIHYKMLGTQDFAAFINDLTSQFSTLDDLSSSEVRVLDPTRRDPSKQPADEFERTKLQQFLRLAELEAAGGGVAAAGRSGPRKAYTFIDGTPIWDARIMPGKQKYQYIQAVLLKPNCLIPCHGGSSGPLKNHAMREVEVAGATPGQVVKRWTNARPGELAGVVVVKIPMEQTYAAINRNRAILIATALATAILAMSASYVIVRYVIVKPLKHLRQVSDAIAAGSLTIRSQIQTGDEFEDLSHAFNRMLHSLVTMQQELRDVNKDLDRKVDELAQANMALFEMNRLKSDFLTTMSHELRTPLNSIIGFSEVLADNAELSEKQRRYAGNILTSGKMLLGMINDILDLAKIESGKMEVRPEDFSIRDLCEALASLTRPMAERKNIDLQCRLDDAIPLLRQDVGKLKQILYNLLSNAIKFTPDGGRVTLRARAEGRFAVLEVADTGIGIAEEDRDTIFEKFRQAMNHTEGDSVLTREHQGTGLGL